MGWLHFRANRRWRVASNKMTPGESRRVGGKGVVDSREKDTAAEKMKMSRATSAELLPAMPSEIRAKRTATKQTIFWRLLFIKIILIQSAGQTKKQQQSRCCCLGVIYSPMSGHDLIAVRQSSRLSLYHLSAAFWIQRERVLMQR